MFNQSKLQEVLAAYKRDFVSKQWPEEKYKWEAVKHFQDHWDVDAPDFADMLSRSLAKTYNLLASGYAYPKGMIINFAQADESAVRDMFRSLFDETRDLAERVSMFQAASEAIRAKYDDGTWHKHYQNTNAISIYLWLKYPDKYYIYKYDVFSDVATELKSDYKPKRNGSVDTLLGGFKFYDELNKMICADEELVSLLGSVIDALCYSDPALKTLTVDIGYYLSRCYLEGKKSSQNDGVWFPMDYTPGLSVDDWITLLKDEEVFTESSLEIMKRMKDYGGQATCKQLSVKYGENYNFYNNGSTALANRIAEQTGCPLPPDDENSRKWPILYLGRYAQKDEDGVYVWKLRPELSEALDKVDLSNVALYAHTAAEDDVQDYVEGISRCEILDTNISGWLLSWNPQKWDWGDDFDEAVQIIKNGGAYCMDWTCANTHVQVGDRVFFLKLGQEPRGIIASGYIISDSYRDEHYDMNKNSSMNYVGIVLTKIIDYRECSFLTTKLLKQKYPEQCWSPQSSGIKIKDHILPHLISDWEKMIPHKPLENTCGCEKYDKKTFLSEVYMTESKYDALVAVLKNKKNIILQGAPGVGKTFAAKRLAYSMMGEMDESRIEFVQFHQNYTYEDFMMGYKPVNDGFELKYGIFYRFCQKAANQPDKDFFFIIDEINRGNMSKIFGELLMLIERDYRGTPATLAYNGMAFAVPKNLYIIGMMNTADRSLAMIDYALRRRFSFFDMEPGFDSAGFMKYQQDLNNETFSLLISKVQELNREITLDKSLGRGFCIGHSYFCGQRECNDEWLQSIVDYDILPMLSEYWFDDTSKLQRWENILRGVFQ